MNNWLLYLILGVVGLIGILLLIRNLGLWLLAIVVAIALAIMGGAVWAQSRATATVATTSTVNSTIFGVIAILAIGAVPVTFIALIYLLRMVQNLTGQQRNGSGRWVSGPNAQWQTIGSQQPELSAWL